MSEFVSIESEQAVLGSMLIDSGCIRDVAAVLRETDFSMALNQELFRVITNMDRDGRPVDGLTACQEIRQFSEVPVGIVIEEENDELVTVMEEVEIEEGLPMFKVTEYGDKK